MKKLFLLFSHSLTDDQRADATLNWEIDDFISLPADLQKTFSNVPADLPALNTYLAPICEWVGKQASAEDYILVQGDFGAVFHIVSYLKAKSLACLYATTERQSVEMPQPDGSIKTERIFKHKIFRRY